jgi:epidermal growth factor receptor substrate 15
VNKLRDQCQKQEETIKEQETELDSRKAELQKLREEEKSLESEYDTNLKEKENISEKLQDTQLQIRQVRTMFSQVEEIQRQMRDALTVCKAAVEENNASMISDYSLNIEPDFREFKTALLSPEQKKKEGELELEKLEGNLLKISYFPAFNDSQSGFNDPFKPSKPAAVSFEDSFDNKTTGFGEDDWHGSSWNNKQNDPFGGSSKPDPFAGSAIDTSAKDVSKF